MKQLLDEMGWDDLPLGMRSCDECGRVTDAGAFPDWPDGICEYCDPSLLGDVANFEDSTIGYFGDLDAEGFEFVSAEMQETWEADFLAAQLDDEAEA